MPTTLRHSRAPGIGHQRHRRTVHQTYRVTRVQQLVVHIAPDGFNDRNQLPAARVEAVQIEQVGKHVPQILGDESVTHFILILKEGLEDQRDGDQFPVRELALDLFHETGDLVWRSDADTHHPPLPGKKIATC
jgi:hypothetical protein